MRARPSHYFAIGTVLVAALMATTQVHSSENEMEIAKIRSAVERFKDVEVALSEGYIRDPTDHCVKAEDVGESADLGVMGIHYFRPDLLGITGAEPRVNGNGLHLDFESPSVLIYEPQADGGLVLVAVENLVFVDAWQAAGNDGPPTLLGRTWDLMADDADTEVDEAHGFEPHYDQHVWVFRDNPLGPLEPFNPAATCDHHVAAH